MYFVKMEEASSPIEEYKEGCRDEVLINSNCALMYLSVDMSCISVLS